MAKNESGGLTWTPCTVTLGELRPWERNPKRLSKAQATRLLASWEALGQFQTLAIGPNGEVYDGHQRLSALLRLYGPQYTVQALRSDRPLTEREREQIAILSVTAVGSFDWDALAGWDASELTAWGRDATISRWRRPPSPGWSGSLRHTKRRCVSCRSRHCGRGWSPTTG